MFDISSQLLTTPNALLIESGQETITRKEAWARIVDIMDNLANTQCRTVALFADNHPTWVLVDLACQAMGICFIPLPLFFSTSQIQHTLDSARVDLILTDQPQRVEALAETFTHADPVEHLSAYIIPRTDTAQIPTGTDKITFTSGSTGDPKGVCLTSKQQWEVAQSLDAVINETTIRHLCVLPLSTLLENISGVYAPVLSGGSIVILPLQDLGFNGSAAFDVNKLLQAITQARPNTMILLPQLLLALVKAVAAGWEAPTSLRFIAVGGGKVAPHLLEEAHNVGLPVYEGYGLSECASVVSLNTPEAYHFGSVGKPLPHVQITIKNGHIMVNQAFLGYMNDPDSWYPKQVDSGDLGMLDEQGYLYIQGRAKNILVTSFGRNINPEWVESECLSGTVIRQCVVFGDAKPFCCALLTSADTMTDQDVQQWIDKTNNRLPDYARIQAWRRLPQPLTIEDGLLTENGRPKRQNIADRFQSLLDEIYQP